MSHSLKKFSIFTEKVANTIHQSCSLWPSVFSTHRYEYDVRIQKVYGELKVFQPLKVFSFCCFFFLFGPEGKHFWEIVKKMLWSSKDVICQPTNCLQERGCQEEELAVIRFQSLNKVCEWKDKLYSKETIGVKLESLWSCFNSDRIFIFTDF